MSTPRLNCKALVTGASRGIGCAVAARLADMGADICGTATTVAGAEAIAQALPGSTGAVLNLSSATLEQDIAELISTQGPFQIVVNNAGMTNDNLIPRVDMNAWDALIRVNLTGAFLVAKACVRGMSRAPWGRIVNMSSVVGTMGNTGQVSYVTSKAGLEGMTRAFAHEYGKRGITVNAVAPGFIETDITANLDEKLKAAMRANTLLQRFGTPEEVASVVGFLCSEAAGYITGQVVQVNGGMYLG